MKACVTDAARALQFVRSKAAEWNLDKTRIGATGGSAGACSSLWLAFHDDLAEMLRRTTAAFAHPVAQALTPGLMAEIAVDPSLHPALLERFSGAWKGFHDRIAIAGERGEVRAGVDTDVLIETLAGAALMRLLIHSDDGLDDHWVEQTTTLLMRGIAA